MFDRKEYLITVDYYANYWKVELLTSTTSRAVINKLRKIFSQHGIPETVLSDNGPQYASDEFKKFAKQWEFKHITSSPLHSQPNGKVENAVGTCKMIMKKAESAKTDVYLPILHFRNTPTAETDSSPVQKLYARRTRTRLPVHEEHLRTATVPNARPKLEAAKAKQAHYFNRGAKALHVLQPGESIRMHLPGATTCSQGKVICQAGPRSYRVECDGTQYRRNRRQLMRATTEPTPTELCNTEDIVDSQQEAEPRDAHQNPNTTAPTMLSTPTLPADARSYSISARVSARGRETSLPCRLKDFEMK